MCIRKVKKKKSKKRWFYKVFIRKKGKMVTCVVEQPVKEDTSRWHKPKWTKETGLIPLRLLPRSYRLSRHVGKFSVFNYRSDAIYQCCCDCAEEVWRVEGRYETLLTGEYDVSPGGRASLIDSFRLDKKVFGR